MRTLRFIERTSRALLRLAPTCFRVAWQEELLATVRETCLAAHRDRGWSGLVFAGVLEMSNIGESALRVRLGGGPPVTAGTPRPPEKRHGRLARILQLVAHDLRLAVRSLSSSRVPVAIAILTLALGIGVNAAVFSIVDSMMLRPVPYADADRLAEIWVHETKSGFSRPGSPPSLLLEWRRQADLFDRVEGHDLASFVHKADQGAEMLTGCVVTPGLLPMLGVKPLLGRLFHEGDGQGGTADRVIISERFWRSALGGDPAVIGLMLTLNDRRYEVVGVMPALFRFPNEVAQFWVPYDIATPPAELAVRPNALTPFARLHPDANVEAVAAQVVARGEEVVAAGGGREGESARMDLGLGMMDRRHKQSLLVLAAAVGFLLLIVCANLANLSLSRALTRSRDFAVRASLGASRRDLIRETLIEHLLIGVIGAALGLLVASIALSLTVDRLPTLMTRGMNAIDLDGRVLGFTALIGILASVLFGLPPAWMASRSGLAGMLRQESRASTGSVASRRMRSVLVVSEVTLAIVLLVGAALMARSFAKLQAVDRGFDTAGLLSVSVGLPTATYADPYERDRFVDGMLEQARRIPGVSGATAGGVPPQSNMISFLTLEFEEHPGDLTDLLVVPIYQVWPDYFSQIGIPILGGRPFADNEPRDSVVVSDSFARKYYPDSSPIGRRYRNEGGAWKTIVGVAGEVRQLDLDDAHGSVELYYPLKRPLGVPPPTRQPTGAIAEYRNVVIRAADAMAAKEPLRRAVHQVDPNVVVYELETIDEAFAGAITRPRVVLLLMTVFAGMGLVLAAAGIYGVLSYLVAQRRREIGIRLALGAIPQQIGRLILGDGLKLTAIGLVIGVAAALSLVRLMQALLYEVEATDPASVLGVVATLLLTAFLASWLPARRAMRVNPVVLLRDE